MFRSGSRLRQIPGAYAQMQALVGAAALITWALFLVPALRTGSMVPWAMAPVGLLFPGWIGFHLWRWWDDRYRSTHSSWDTTKTTRVMCFGSDRQLSRLLPLSDQFFEPEYVNNSWWCGSLVPPGRFEVACVVMALLGSLVFCFLEIPGLTGTFSFPTLIAMTALGTLTFQSTLRPVHLRMVPGRLDLIVSRPLGLGTPRIERIDLRQSRVEVRMYERVVSVRSENGADRELGGMLIPEWPRVARAIVLAALSAHGTPETAELDAE